MSISKKTGLDFIKGKKIIEKVYLEYKNLMYFIITSYENMTIITFTSAPAPEEHEVIVLNVDRPFMLYL